jgi:hypothetical protein
MARSVLRVRRSGLLTGRLDSRHLRASETPRKTLYAILAALISTKPMFLLIDFTNDFSFRPKAIFETVALYWRDLLSSYYKFTITRLKMLNKD